MVRIAGLKILRCLLERFERVESESEQNSQHHPGCCRTAAKMGLVDYYLRMIQWRRRNSFAPALSKRNFLGADYSAGPYTTAAIANGESALGGWQSGR
ncbi:MAG TPA: hypothetical protein DCG12_03025 [Planctomycetaceae bacterium]|nr:hypothetical protein [Planctomycetaceae bacterium]